MKAATEVLENSLIIEQVITLKHKPDVPLRSAARFFPSSVWTGMSSKKYSPLHD